MKKDRPRQQAELSDICLADISLVIQVKPASKNEVGVMAYLRAPAGITSLEVNARSVQDIESADNTGRFWTTCLHSDIARWRNKHGIEIIGESEKYTSQRGYSAYFTRYRIASRSAATRAVILINRWRAERGLPSIDSEEADYLINQFPEDQTAA